MAGRRAVTVKPDPSRQPAVAPRGILAVDVGSAWTKVLLIGRVEGQYRLLGRASAPTVLGGLFGAAGGLIEASRLVERATGHRLLAGDSVIVPMKADGGGVDAVAVATSAAPYLRVVALGVGEEQSMAGAVVAARHTYCDLEATVSADGGLEAGQLVRWSGLGGGGLQAIAAELLRLDPEVVLLTGGHDGGATESVRSLARAVAAAGGTRHRVVVYAGNIDAREIVEAELAGTAELVVVGNVAPRPGAFGGEEAGLALHRLYRERKLAELPGQDHIRAMVQGGLETSADGLWAGLRFLARAAGVPVASVDVGSSTTVAGWADGDVLWRQVRTRFGTAGGGISLLAEAGIAAVARWLPFDIGDAEVLALTSAREADPLALPSSPRAARLEGALLREALRRAGGAAQAGMLVGAGGSLARSLPAEVALALLDGLQPVGVCRLALDSAGLLGTISALGRVEPEAAAGLLLGDGLLHLGTAICPAVAAPAGTETGRPVLRVRVIVGERVIFDEELASGTLRRLPLPAGADLKVEARPAKGVDMGFGPGVPALLETEGAGLGLILDCRGRPFEPPDDIRTRIPLLESWYSALA